MEDTTQDLGTAEGDADEGGGTETPAAPQFMTAEQVTAIMQQQTEAMTSNFQQLIGGLNPPKEPEREPTLQAPSLEEIAAAYEEGETAKGVQLQAQREAALEQRITGQLQGLRNDGLGWVSSVNRELHGNKDPIYAQYKDEIDGVLNSMGPEAGNNPTLIQSVTDMVKGRHIDEIIQQRAEAAARQANSDPTADTGQRTRTAAGRPAQRVANIFVNEKGAAALQQLGMSPDDFAKKRGYDSWEAYDSMFGEVSNKPAHRWQYTQTG